MTQIDFSYLDRFAGEKAKVTLQVSPNLNRGKSINEVIGRIMPGSKWASLSFLDNAHKPEHDKGQLIARHHIGEGVYYPKWSTMPFLLPRGIPYLGLDTTFWKIEKLDNGLVLFDHVRVSEDTYNLVNHEQKVLGQITLPLPYVSPYDCWEAVKDLTGKDHMDKFLAWRENLVRRVD